MTELYPDQEKLNVFVLDGSGFNRRWPRSFSIASALWSKRGWMGSDTCTRSWTGLPHALTALLIS